MAKIDRETLKQTVDDHVEKLCQHYFAGGKRINNQWVVGNVNGDPGQSLRIELEGDKIGLAFDFATGIGCDFLDLIKNRTGLRFAEVAREIGKIAGVDVEEPVTQYATGKGARYRTGSSVKPCDWDSTYKMVSADIEELMAWRGYSRSFCEWAVQQRLIGRDKQGQWAFPVYDNNGTIVSAHIRIDKNRWLFLPTLKALGLSLSPLIAGELATAEKVFSDESPWDLYAVLDKLGVQHGEQIAGVATRGAANAGLIASIEIKAELFAIPQNDDPGQQWVETLGTMLTRSFKIIVVPAPHHDANDWLKALVDINEFVEAIRNATTKEPNRPETKAERAESFEKSIVSGQEFAGIQIPPKEIIIEDWLKEGEVGFIYAYRGTGKTWFTLSLCIAIAEGILFGPWAVPIAYPVLYVDGEMSHDDNVTRITGLCGKIPNNLHILNHEVLFHKTGKVINLANRIDQEILLQTCLTRKVKALVLDNLSCLFVGVGENDADEWNKVKPWLLELRRHGISPIIDHHTGVDQSRMRGTSSREDAASWVLRLDNKKDDYDQTGAHFISRFTKYRGKSRVLDYEWIFKPDINDAIKVSVAVANRDEVFLQWVKDGLNRCEDIAQEMGITKGRASQIAARLIDQGKLRKKGREYELV